MSRNDVFEKVFFVAGRIIFTLVSAVWYMCMMFRCVGDLSFRDSVIILGGIVMTALILGTLIQLGKRHEERSILSDLSVAYGVYAIISYWGKAWKLIVIVLVLSLAALLYYTMPSMIRKVRRGKDPVRVISRALRRGRDDIRNTIACAIMIVLSCLICFSATENIADPARMISVKPEKTEDVDHTIKGSMETLMLLDNSNWRRLTEEEKLSVMQTVLDIERDNLGIPCDLYLHVGNIKDGALGSYNDSTHQINLSRDHLNNDYAFDVVNTIAHEAHHAYAHRTVDLLSQVDEEYRSLIIFDDVKEYKEEINNYISAEVDHYGYISQTLETKAREYAWDRQEDYYYAVYHYVHDNDPGSMASKYTINDNIYEYDIEDERYSNYGEYIAEVTEGELEYYSYIITSYGNKGVIDKEGNIIVLPVYKDIFADLEYMDSQDGVCMVSFVISYYSGGTNTYTYCWPVNEL